MFVHFFCFGRGNVSIGTLYSENTNVFAGSQYIIGSTRQAYAQCVCQHTNAKHCTRLVESHT